MSKRLAAGRHRRTVVNNDGHTIGLDIGATAIRAAVLEPSLVNGRPFVTMHSVAIQELAPGVVVNGLVQEPDSLTAALKQLWSAYKIPCDRVILGVANQQVIVRDMTIPDLEPEHRAKALPFQAREVVALPIDQVVLDFCQLGDPDPETSMVRGLLMATPREPVLTAVNAVERAGLKVARVDLSSLGSLRSIAHHDPAVEAIVDMGAHLTTIIVHDQGIPKLVRTLAQGGQAVTEQLADRLAITELEAEHAKREIGMDGTGSEVERILADALRPLLNEVRTSVQYFRLSSPGTQIARLALTGGGSALPGLAVHVQEQVGLPAQLVDPMQHVQPNPRSSRWPTLLRSASVDDDDAPSAVAVGLAMGFAA